MAINRIEPQRREGKVEIQNKRGKTSYGKYVLCSVCNAEYLQVSFEDSTAYARPPFFRNCRFTACGFPCLSQSSIGSDRRLDQNRVENVSSEKCNPLLHLDCGIASKCLISRYCLPGFTGFIVHHLPCTIYTKCPRHHAIAFRLPSWDHPVRQI